MKLEDDIVKLERNLYAGPGCIEIHGFDAVICLDDSCKVKTDKETRIYCYPLKAGEIVPFSNFKEAIRQLHKLMKLNKYVYVHCRNGCVRTGTLLATYYILYKGEPYYSTFGAYGLESKCYTELFTYWRFLDALENLVREFGQDFARKVFYKASSPDEVEIVSYWSHTILRRNPDLLKYYEE